MLRWCPPSLSPRPDTAGAQLSARGGPCLSPHRWWQALDCGCPWPGWAAHPNESGPWKWLKPCQPCRAALAVSGCVQVSPPAPSLHGDWRSKAQGGPCRDAEYYISQSLQGKGRRGVTVRPQDPTTRSPCHLESPASLPASERSPCCSGLVCSPGHSCLQRDTAGVGVFLPASADAEEPCAE